MRSVLQNTCGQCKHYDPVAELGDDMGMCRRYPPMNIVTMTEKGPQEMSKFPLTGLKHWCGEFQVGILLS